MRKRIEAYIRNWTSKGYPDGLPDEAPRRLEEANKVGSYRQICIALMKNDWNLLTLGNSRPPCQIYMSLKRAELIAKGKISASQPEQERMF